MSRTCPHCHEELPDPTPEELGQLLSAAISAQLTEPALEPPPAQGVGRWVDTPDGPAFAVDPAAMQAAREARQREREQGRR